MDSKIKQARLAAGLTQKDMEVIYSIPVRTLQNWETGKAQPPDFESIKTRL